MKKVPRSSECATSLAPFEAFFRDVPSADGQVTNNDQVFACITCAVTHGYYPIRYSQNHFI